jgi:hypothetical protein
MGQRLKIEKETLGKLYSLVPLAIVSMQRRSTHNQISMNSHTVHLSPIYLIK